MKFIDIHPFVRFSAVQNFTREILFLRNETISYDNRIYYCLKGKGRLYIDNQLFLIEPYSFVMWQAGHCYKLIPDPGDDFICITCNFDYTHSNSNLITPIIPSNKAFFNKNKILEHVFFEDYQKLNQIIYIQKNPHIYELLNKLVETYKTQLVHYQIHLNSYLLQIILLASEHLNDLDNSNNKKVIGDIIKYIHENYRNDVSNKDIAEVFAYHPNYISSLMVSETGYSLHNYLVRYRLSRAFNYLMNTNMPIKRICDEINITNYSYFSRLFKKYYGVSPQKIRNNTKH